MAPGLFVNVVSSTDKTNENMPFKGFLDNEFN